MRFIYFLIPVFLLAGCFSNQAYMSRETYSDVDVGMTSKDLEERFGKPYQVYSKGDNTETYEYIERITMGTQVVEQRRYYIVIENGKVISKYMKVSNPPPFEAIYSDDPYRNY